VLEASAALWALVLSERVPSGLTLLVLIVLVVPVLSVRRPPSPVPAERVLVERPRVVLGVFRPPPAVVSVAVVSVAVVPLALVRTVPGSIVAVQFRRSRAVRVRRAKSGRGRAQGRHRGRGRHCAPP
jgi:hypothetical protein